MAHGRIASGPYYLTPNSVNNGHPEERLGTRGRAKFNLPGQRHDRLQVCYSEGAAGFCPEPSQQNNLFATSRSCAFVYIW
jgi:hypothetical protein